MKYQTIFAQGYGNGNYSDCAYNSDMQCATVGGNTGNNSGSAAGGGLANTGISLIFIVTLACLLIFVSLIIRFWKRKPTPVAQEVEEIEDKDKRFVERF